MDGFFQFEEEQEEMVVFVNENGTKTIQSINESLKILFNSKEKISWDRETRVKQNKGSDSEDEANSEESEETISINKLGKEGFKKNQIVVVLYVLNKEKEIHEIWSV